MTADFLAGFQAAIAAMCAADCDYCAVNAPAHRDEVKGASVVFYHLIATGERRTCWATRVRRLADRFKATADAGGAAEEKS